MNARRIILLTGVTILVLFGFSCSRMEWHTSGNHAIVHLDANETHEGWYFAMGDRVEIDGTVNGDAYVVARIVNVTGKITGDLIVAGQTVSITGTVTDHVRAAGQNIMIGGTIGNDVSLAGQYVNVNKTAVLAGGVLAAASDCDISGTVLKGAKVASRNLSITGTINGDVDFSGAKIYVQHPGGIVGQLHAHVRDHKDVVLEDSTMHGDVRIDVTPDRDCEQECHWVHRAWFGLFWFLGLLVTGLILLLLFPAPFGQIGAAIMQHPGKSLLWSVIGIFCIPALSVIFMITVLGIPIGLILILIYAGLLYLSQMALGIALGRRLMGMEGKRGFHLFLAFFVGLAIVQLLHLIPVVGALVVVAGLFFGVGAILIVLSDGWKKIRS